MKTERAESYIRCDADELEAGGPALAQLTPSEVIARHHTKIRRAIELLEDASQQITDTIDPDAAEWPDVWKVSAAAEAAAELIERLER